MTKQRRVLWQHKKLVVALLVVIVGIIGAVIWLQKVNSSSATTANKALKSDSSELSLEIIQSKLQQQQLQIQDLQSQLQTLSTPYAKAPDWKPITIDYLARMADLTLATTRDIKTALNFLLTAKQYATDPALSDVSHALNQVIAQLQALPQVTAENVILQIDALMQQIDNLSLLPKPQPIVTATVANQAAKPQPIWQRIKDNTIASLRNIVIIRHQTIEPIPAPEQAVLLRLNIRTKLLQAELAALHREDQVFQTSLSRAEEWIGKYFAANDTVTTNIIMKLRDLRQLEFNPKLPSLSALLQVVAAAINVAPNYITTPSTPTTPSTQPQPAGAKLL